jgi:uncharacterized membrane protein
MADAWITSFYQFMNSLGYIHPIHAAFVHMPIGLVVGAFIFGWLAFLFNREKLARSATHCILLAFLFWFPAVLFGFMDWQHFWGGAWLTLIKLKMVLAGILFIFLVISLLFVFKDGVGSKGALTGYTFCFFTVVLLGHFGGQLVFGDKGRTAPRNYTAGEKIYLARCSNCHPNGGNAIKPGMPVKNSPKLQDFDMFLSWIRHPDPPMPPSSAADISQNQAKELYAYIVNVLDRAGVPKGGT